MVEVASALTIVQKAIEFAKKVKDIELESKLLDLKGMINDLKGENLDLKEKIGELEKTSKLKSELVVKDEYYYQGEDGPFCTKCFDDEGKLIRVVTEWKQTGQTCRKCPKCNTTMVK